MEEDAPAALGKPDGLAGRLVGRLLHERVELLVERLFEILGGYLAPVDEPKGQSIHDQGAELLGAPASTSTQHESR